MNGWRRHPIWICMVGGALLAALAVAPPEAARGGLASRWLDVEIRVDGDNGDWPILEPLSAESPFSVGLANDERHLYVTLASSDPMARIQVIARGLVLWFDAEGTKKKRFGIKYPVEPAGFGPGRGTGGPRSPGGFNQDRLQPDFADGRWTRLEILGRKVEENRNLMLDHVPGIAVKVGSADGTLVYELKVPLLPDDGNPYAIGAGPGALIGFGLETPEVRRNESRPGMGGPGGGIGRPGGRMGGGPGGMGGSGPRRGTRGSRMKPLNEWTTIRLAIPGPVVQDGAGRTP